MRSHRKTAAAVETPAEDTRRVSADGLAQSKALRPFTEAQVESRLLFVLLPPVSRAGGQLATFGEWGLDGHGVVIVLGNGQQFRLSIGEVH